MKIKIALLGLFLANSITHLHADQYAYKEDLEECKTENENDNDNDDDKVDKKNASENLIKLGATFGMNPCLKYQDETFSHKNKISAELKFSADVPEAWCKKNATIDINGKWDGKEFAIKKAALSIGKMVKMGYDSTIFGYEKADSASIISAGATVLQAKYTYEFDWFRIATAIERAVEPKVGHFDKDHLEEKGDSSRTNKFDKSDDKERPFKIKNSWPAAGIHLGVVTDDCNIGLSALFRFTDYTHNTKPDKKNHYLTCGANLGIQCEIVPKKFTATAQGIYVYGLGDYIPGLANVQNDEKREEMCAVYYADKSKDDLSAISAWGGSGCLKYCATPKWTLSLSGSYLTTLKDETRPGKAFKHQYNVAPKISYEVNKYFTLSGGYTIVKEWRIDTNKDKGYQNKFSGTIKFSLK